MELFKYLNNEKFFNPFTGDNKQIYYECICELIAYAKTTPILYESEVRNVLEIFLSNKQLTMEVDDEATSNESDAVKIIRKFRQCGWLSKPTLARNGEYHTLINGNIRQIVLLLQKLSNRKDNAAISNRILSMYEILQSVKSENSPRKDRPYSSLIAPLLNDMEELKNEVYDLKDNINIIITQMSEMHDLSNLGHYFLSDELLEKCFSDYFYMKNNGLIPLYLASISDALRDLKYDDLLKVAVKEYSESYGEDSVKSTEILMAYIDKMFVYVSDEYPQQMEEIDYRIAKYYRLANLRLRLVTSNGMDLQSSINSVLTALKLADKNEKEELINCLQQCITIESQKYISRKSYQVRKRDTSNNCSGALVVEDISETEKDAMTNALFLASVNPYSLDKTNTFFDHLFANGNYAIISSNHITTKEDALMFASALIYSSDDSFNYSVELTDGFSSNEVVSISNMNIRRKEK